MGNERPKWDEIERPVRRIKLRDERILLERIDIDAIRERMETEKAPTLPIVPYTQFAKLDIRVGVIRQAVEIEGADRLYRLTVDFGTERRTCVAGIKASYSIDQLIDRQVAAVVNLEPRTVHGVKSECLLLAAEGEGLSLIAPDRPVKPGTPVK